MNYINDAKQYSEYAGYSEFLLNYRSFKLEFTAKLRFN